MELNYKRKLDCILDTSFENPQFQFVENTRFHLPADQANKKVKISLNARVEPYACHDDYVESETFRTSCSVDGSMQVEDETKASRHCGEYDEMEDIPTTNEVIDSLRKVMLWMLAQDDSDSHHIQYLSNVERYALSKRDAFGQQRKITEYFVRHD